MDAIGNFFERCGILNKLLGNSGWGYQSRSCTIKLLFATGPSINTRLLVAVITSIALLVTEHNNQQLDKLRSFLSFVVDPLKYLVSVPTNLLQNASDTIRTYASLKEENQKLHESQLIHQTRLLKLEALEKENIRLRALLDNSFKLGEQVLVAEILSVKAAPFEHIVTVNKGTRFGVHPQQPVLDANGVVGQVFRSQPLTADIMLITDLNHAIPVEVNRNGLLTIAVGSGNLNQLILPYLPNNADIHPGDLLITSGLGGTFPQGYPVAVVDQFTSQPNKPFASITATPKAQLDRNRELMIVWSNAAPIPLTGKPANETTEEKQHAQP